MEKTILPEGVTLNGKRGLYLDEQVQMNTKVYKDQIHPQNRRKNGKAKFYERPPSKLQRVNETIIYSQERINKLNREKHIKEFRNEFRNYYRENFEHSTISVLIIAAFGVEDKYRSVDELSKDMVKFAEGRKRTGSVDRKILSFHVSEIWSKARAVCLFIEKYGEVKPYKYKLTDMGYRLGPELLVKLKSIVLEPGIKFDTMRLRLSSIRLAARKRGVTEAEFNDYLKEQYEIFKVKVTKVVEERRQLAKSTHAPKKKKPKSFNEQIMEAFKEGKQEKETKEMPATTEVLSEEPVKKTLPTPEFKMPTKISIDLKIWFIPVTGTLKIEP